MDLSCELPPGGAARRPERWLVRGALLVRATLAICAGSSLSACDSDGSAAGNGAAERRASKAQALAGGEPWNFVLFLTDDQRFDTLWAMPVVRNRLMAEGVTFTNSYASTPLCCPFRASTLSGGFLAQNTGVLVNQGTYNGGLSEFDEANSLAVFLAAAGYRTALFGKYLHEYPYDNPYVPPGFTQFSAALSYSVSGALMDKADAFLDQYGADPFFMVIAPYNPHAPASIYSEADATLFTDYVYRERGFGETDIADKPQWFAGQQNDHGPDADTAEEEDELHRRQLRSLQDVDRGVGLLLDRLEELGVLDRTVFFFTSDNGYMWGEHGLFAKGWAYEESTRVPFVVRMPGVDAREDSALTAANLDIPATIWDLAGLPHRGDGLSLAARLNDSNTPLRESLFLESFGINYPTLNFQLWASLRTQDEDGQWRYTEYGNGTRELYDLDNDPFELQSLHADATQASRLGALRAQLRAAKGLAITSLVRFVVGEVGQPLQHRLSAWGGSGTYVWSAVAGELPAGLAFDPVTATIGGTPEEGGDFAVTVQVEDSTAMATYRNTPQRFVHEIVLRIAGGVDTGGPDAGVDAGMPDAGTGVGGAGGSGGGGAGAGGAGTGGAKDAGAGGGCGAGSTGGANAGGAGGRSGADSGSGGNAGESGAGNSPSDAGDNIGGRKHSGPPRPPAPRDAGRHIVPDNPLAAEAGSGDLGDGGGAEMEPDPVRDAGGHEPEVSDLRPGRSASARDGGRAGPNYPDAGSDGDEATGCDCRTIPKSSSAGFGQTSPLLLAFLFGLWRRRSRNQANAATFAPHVNDAPQRG